jgi:hypothetical protein
MKIQKTTYFLLIGLLLIVGGFLLVRHWTNLKNNEDYEDPKEDIIEDSEMDHSEDPEEKEKKIKVNKRAAKQETNDTTENAGEVPAVE